MNRPSAPSLEKLVIKVINPLVILIGLQIRVYVMRPVKSAAPSFEIGLQGGHPGMRG